MGKKTDYVRVGDRMKLSAGDVIRVACEMLGMSQAELARRSKIAPSHISAIIAGKKPIGKVVASRLGRVLNVSPGQILFAGENPREGSHVVEALEKNAEDLRARNRQVEALLKGSLKIARLAAKSSPKLKELMIKLEQARAINEEEDITGLYLLAKSVLQGTKEQHKG